MSLLSPDVNCGGLPIFEASEFSAVVSERCQKALGSSLEAYDKSPIWLKLHLLA